MCERGDVCEVCGHAASAVFHWREFAMKLCAKHGAEKMIETAHAPRLIVPIGEPHAEKQK